MITDTVEKSAEILKDFLVENTIPVLPIKEYSGCLKPIINFVRYNRLKEFFYYANKKFSHKIFTRI